MQGHEKQLIDTIAKALRGPIGLINVKLLNRRSVEAGSRSTGSGYYCKKGSGSGSSIGKMNRCKSRSGEKNSGNRSGSDKSLTLLPFPLP